MHDVCESARATLNQYLKFLGNKFLNSILDVQIQVCLFFSLRPQMSYLAAVPNQGNLSSTTAQVKASAICQLIALGGYASVITGYAMHLVRR